MNIIRQGTSLRTSIIAALVLVCSAGAATPAQGAAVESVSASAIVREVRIVDFNIRRSQTALNLALSRAINADAIGITLQEVCLTQYQQLVNAYPNWTFAFDSFDRPRVDCQGGLDGTVAIWTGGNDGGRDIRQFTAQYGEETASLVCVGFLEGIRYRICSAHLTPFDLEARHEQAQNVKFFTRDWIDAGLAVFLGGDFNATPDRVDMDRIYKYGDGADGRFREAHTVNGADCQCGPDTTMATDDRKIDYVFLSDNRVADPSARRLVVVDPPPGSSDHKMLVGVFKVRVS